MKSPHILTLVAGVAAVALTGCQQPAVKAPDEAQPVAEADSGRGGPPDGERRGPREPQTLADSQGRMERMFERRDTNGDGVITADELNSDEGGRGGRMLERADANDDGRITREEVQAAAAEMFRRMDANGDGVVSEDERPQRGERGGPPA